MQQYLPLPQMIEVSMLPAIPLAQREQLPHQAGIYFVLHGEVVRYIGQTKSLRERWKNHNRIPQYATTAAVTIAYLLVSNPNLLRSVEKACIAYFDPLDNRKGYNERWAKVAVTPDVKRNIALLSLDDDCKEYELVRKLVEQEMARRKGEPHHAIKDQEPAHAHME